MATSIQSNLEFKITSIITVSDGIGDTFTISTDLEREQLINATLCSIVLKTADRSTIERMQVTIVDGEATIILRGLDQSDTKTEVEALKKERRVGTTGYLTMLASDLFDKDGDGDQTINGNITFEGEVTFDDKMILTKDSDFNMSEANNPLILPNLTTIEREALTPENGAIVYDADLGLNYQYTGGSRGSIDTGTSVGNATETVAGLVQKATDDEFDGGENTGSTGAFLFMTPKQFKDNPQQELANNDYYMGENGVVGKTVFVEENIAKADATETQNIGDVTGNTRVAVRVFGSSIVDNIIDCKLPSIIGSPSTDLEFRLETDNSGQPSGTLANVNAIDSLTTAEVLAGNIPTLGTVTYNTPVDNDFDFTGFTTDAGASAKSGYRFTANKNTKLNQVTLHSSCTATRVLLYKGTGETELLETASVTSLIADFDTLLISGEVYEIKADNSGSGFTRISLATTYPIGFDDITITTGLRTNTTYDELYNIEQITTEALIYEDLGLTEGTPYRLVISQTGDTVNASNYFTIAYSSQQTSTRSFTTYDGTSYGGGVSFGDTFTGSTINTDFWTNNGASQYGQLNLGQSQSGIDLTTIDTYEFDGSIQADLKVLGYGDNDNVGQRTSLFTYIDGSNYIEVYKRKEVLGGSNPPETAYIGYQIVSGGLQVASFEILVDTTTTGVAPDETYTTMKIEYSQSTGLIKAYYYDGGRTQLGTDETYILGTPKFILKGLKSGVSQSFYGSRVDNFYYITGTYSAQYPGVGGGSGFIYLSSCLFYDRLLSYTNAGLSYKTKDPLILKNNYSIGSKALVGFDGINNDQSEMTPGAIQYLSDTAGEISETAGTNKYQIGQSITDESMKYDIANLKTETPTVGASPYTYQNTETNEQKVMITGGTVSSVQYSRDGSTFYTQGTATNTEAILGSGDYVKTTYSSIPTFTIFNK